MRPAHAKSSQDPISTIGSAQWYTPVIPATAGSINRRMAVQADQCIKVIPKVETAGVLKW
jgi:hypothetical protein